MRNAILPPVSTQFYNFGNNETQIPNMDVPVAMDNNVNLQGSSVYWEPNFSCDWNQQRSDSFANPCQPIVNFQPSSVDLRGYQSTSSDMKSISYRSMLSKNISVPDVEMDSGTIKLRKRPYEVGSLMPQTGISDVFEHKKARFSREWKEKKSTKAKFTEEKLHNLISESTNIQDNYKDVKLQEPVRRSQKLSDKITALQKLVSPYGKTDTASVLQEASLYIKLLHEQIQNSFDMLCTSYLTDIDVEFPDLKKKGLCLVPISLVPTLTQEDRLPPHEYSKKSFIDRNF